MNKFARTNALYNKYAKEFADKLEQIPEREQLDQFINLLHRKAKVLDLGCGSGRDAQYLHDNGLEVLGIDLSEGLIKEAQLRHPEADFAVMDIQNLNLPEDEFDGVWSKLTILHIAREDLPGLLQDLLRIIKGNGVLMIETKAGSGEAMEPVSFNKEEKRLFVYYSLDELLKLFKEAGFVEVSGYYYSADGKHATQVQDRVVVLGRKG